MAAGALSAHGAMHTIAIVLLAVVACLAGDGIWFWFGRKWGSKAIRLLCRFTSDPRNSAKRARDKFRRYGPSVLCVSKFFPGLDAAMPPLAGAEAVPLTRFLALDAVGSLLWAGFYVGLGYALSNQLNVAIRFAQQFGTTLGIVIGIPIAIWAGSRGLILLRTMHQLRLRRISPRMLARKLKSKGKVAVLDLLQFEEETDNDSLEAIPGAFRVDPLLLQESPQITVPDDVAIILYCSSGSDVVSARAAVGLKRIGVSKVWVLEGGLKAWREQGFPVSQSLEAPELIAERFGVRLPEQRLA
jgi:membrane protein DedA with SNARE-associated domain/rhodanese-related sulfurtransferase